MRAIEKELAIRRARAALPEGRQLVAGLAGVHRIVSKVRASR